MEVAHRVGQLVLFFNLVQFGEIERAKPQFFFWLLDYPDGGKIKRGVTLEFTCAGFSQMSHSKSPSLPNRG